VWQIWSVAAVFFLSTVQTAANCQRVINSQSQSLIDSSNGADIGNSPRAVYVLNYGRREYIDNYRQRPVGPFLSFLGLIIITVVQFLVRSRTVALRRSIWHGPPNWVQKGCTILARILLPVSLVAGFVGTGLVLQYPK
jgi:hypothetical protein